MRILPIAALWALVLSGCGSILQVKQSGDTVPGQHDASVELRGVPFYPQERFQCGPAALAMMLRWSGVDVDPEDLIPQVYVPDLKGSLQAEMISSARRHGRMAYVLAPELSAIFSEVEAGNPILVMQDLSWIGSGRWHYAVVIGFDTRSRSIILRSGTSERLRMSMGKFERTWSRGARWAVVISAPDAIPATAGEREWLKALVELERVGGPWDAEVGWLSATIRWPDSTVAWFGLGNHRIRTADYMSAASIFEHVLTLHPDYPPALNNLAHALAKAGLYDEAESVAERAIKANQEYAPYRRTLMEIRSDRKLKSGENNELPVAINNQERDLK